MIDSSLFVREPTPADYRGKSLTVVYGPLVTMEMDFDIVIVGAGAAGLAAGIFAAETTRTARIALLDGARSIGAKILVSGGGRCNVAPAQATPDDFNGPRTIIRNILAAFDAKAAAKWFGALGVKLKHEEGGKLFPATDSAQTILDALVHRCRQLNVEIRTGHRVLDVQRDDSGFSIQHGAGTLRARSVILATGGQSIPKTGSDGQGWQIARQLGHTVTPTHPALVPLLLEKSMFHGELSGLSCDVELSTFAEGKLVDRRGGSLLWTHFGISGPAALDASRHWIIARSATDTVQMLCNFRPGQSFEQTEQQLIRLAADRPRASIATVLDTFITRRLAAALCAHCGIDSSRPAGQLSRQDRRKLIHSVVALPLPVIGHRGWEFAEVTAGGVPLNEIDYRTMQSRKTPGLYLAGEMLDCDGRIGGFNFLWAWATGHQAGQAAGGK